MKTLIVSRSTRKGEWNQIGKTFETNPLIALTIFVAFDLWAMDHKTAHLSIRGLAPHIYDMRLKEFSSGRFRAESIQIEDNTGRGTVIFRRISCPCGEDACCSQYKQHMAQELGIH